MIKKELCVVSEIYTTRDGTEKKKWLRIGEIHTSKDGKEYMTLDPIINLAAIPRREGDSRVFVSMFEPKEKGGAAAPGPQESYDGDDDIPF